MLLLFRKFCLGGFVLLSVTTQAECNPQQTERGRGFELGVTYQTLLPSGLPDWQRAQAAYGVVLGAPVLGGTLQLHGGLGATAGMTLQVAEVSYRTELPTPYFSPFAAIGAHYWRYALPLGAWHEGPGANVALGIALFLDRQFELVLKLQTYIQQRTTVSFGAGFSFLI